MGVRASPPRRSARGCGRGDRDPIPPAPSSEEMRQHLIVDADDTLWENNIYFERAFEEFTEFLAHSSMPAQEIREALDEIEIVNAKIHGYGSKNNGRNLRESYQRPSRRPNFAGALEPGVASRRPMLH